MWFKAQGQQLNFLRDLSQSELLVDTVGSQQ